MLFSIYNILVLLWPDLQKHPIFPGDIPLTEAWSQAEGLCKPRSIQLIIYIILYRIECSFPIIHTEAHF